MFPRPEYHAGKRRREEHRNEIRVLAGALARLLEEESVQTEWRGAPPGSFQRSQRARQRQPYFYGYQTGAGNWPRYPQRGHRRHPRPYVLPRKGPPVASMKGPQRYRHGEWEERRPRGSNPRGPLRGGPERPADDPRRTPQGGLCGGPGRSVKEPRTPPNTSHVETNGGTTRNGARDKRPIIVTVDKNGQERRWGPLS